MCQMQSQTRGRTASLLPHEKCALLLLLLSLAAFAQTGKQSKPLTNDDVAQHDATDFVRDLSWRRL
jgi:hypothetical protein